MRACVQCVSHVCGTYTHVCVTVIKDVSPGHVCCMHVILFVCVCVKLLHSHVVSRALPSMIAHGVQRVLGE